MRKSFSLFTLLALTLIVTSAPVRAQSGDPGTPTIMAPEPKGKAARSLRKKHIGSSSTVYPISLPPPLHYQPPPVRTVIPEPNAAPPSMYVPQTGMRVPNLPSVGGAGPGGSETSQDRAVRCAHQAGVYGPAAGDQGSYIRSCINQ
jgi:hypothetical protein